MAFCSFSSEKILSDSTTVSNIFINEYLPFANDACVKVYLYGLYQCSHSDSFDNTLKSFSSILNISEEDVENCFRYWEEQGLVKVLNINPIEVRYLPVSHNRGDKEKLKAGKYSDFCASVQEIITGRMVSTNEFYEYMSFLDYSHMEPAALLMIIKYCTTLKGSDIGYSYILTVAKAWAYKKLLTAEQIEAKLSSIESENDKISLLLKVFGVSRKPTLQDNEIFATLTEDYGFEFNVIMAVAKSMKLKNKMGLNLLKNRLDKYYALSLFTINEIEEYEEQKDIAFAAAKDVVKNLGLYYDNLEPVVETYVYKWIKLGYDNDTLVNIAKYCFKSNIKTLEAMDNRIQKLYKIGLVSSSSLDSYMQDLQQTDKQIKKILEEVGVDRLVSSYDRDYYRTWSFSWNLSDELILFAAKESKGKVAPMQYLNRLLNSYHERKVTTIEEAQKVTLTSQSTQTDNKVVNNKSYSAEDLSALFDNLNDIKI